MRKTQKVDQAATEKHKMKIIPSLLFFEKGNLSSQTTMSKTKKKKSLFVLRRTLYKTHVFSASNFFVSNAVIPYRQISYGTSILLKFARTDFTKQGGKAQATRNRKICVS